MWAITRLLSEQLPKAQALMQILDFSLAPNLETLYIEVNPMPSVIKTVSRPIVQWILIT